jgi:hypothetical protein
MKIEKFSQLNENFFVEKSQYFWDLRQSIYNQGYEDEQIVDFFIDELGKEESRKILDKLLNKLERDDY